MLQRLGAVCRTDVDLDAVDDRSVEIDRCADEEIIVRQIQHDRGVALGVDPHP